MPTPKKFIEQVIQMETFFEDEEPTYDEFMRYPPFDSLMEDEFSLQNMINAYREGRIVFIVTETAKSDFKKQKICNFITKEKPNIVFTIYNSSPTTYDEIDPTILNENTHEALMKVKLEDMDKTKVNSENYVGCKNLTLEQESAFSSFIAKTLYTKTEKTWAGQGKQSLVVIWGKHRHLLLTTPYLKIYEPFNTNLPEFVSNRLTELFERAKV
jgi:hypothetical protein|tara:strand:+ start:2898 stop:3536 length:639 start_codon:yes stop_codon:yes gene_type:complete